MRILMVSAEMAPLAKVGGLADAVAGLAGALGARGHDVRVVLPRYDELGGDASVVRPLRKLPPLSLRVGTRAHDVRYHVAGRGRGGVRVYLVEADVFAGPGVYDDDRSLTRSALLAQAALMLPRLLDWSADIVHAHDAHAVPALLGRNQWYAGRGLPGTGATILTIHNLAHQEVHPPSGVAELGLPPGLAVYPGLLEFHGHVNLLKAGILAADRLNTVSPGYARETTGDPEYGCGLEGMLAGRGEDYVGILNGGDYVTWDPSRDPHLPAAYGPRDLAGKATCRAELARELGLEPAADRPLCGFVGRLVHQKGADLLAPLLDRLTADGFTFAVLGTGDPEHEAVLRAAAARLPGRVAFRGVFDESLAHRIYAGSDLFLMPSRFEPCGLSQMYALRYGTPPVVRRTGGLADTVVDAGAADGTGFVFDEARPEKLMAALRRAEAVLADPPSWRALMERGMACDFGWDRAARGYEDLYAAALAARREVEHA
jgi:starch synthase